MPQRRPSITAGYVQTHLIQPCLYVLDRLQRFRLRQRASWCGRSAGRLVGTGGEGEEFVEERGEARVFLLSGGVVRLDDCAGEVLQAGLEGLDEGV